MGQRLSYEAGAAGALLGLDEVDLAAGGQRDGFGNECEEHC